MYCYRAYGLQLTSNRRVPGLLEAQEASADLAVDLSGRRPDFVSVLEWIPCASRADSADESVEVSSANGGEAGTKPYWRVRYPAGKAPVDFIVDGGGRYVWAVWSGDVAFDDVTSYLVGPVLGLVLRLRGITCVHAAVLAASGRGLAIVGPKAAGKSTTAAGLARQGFAVVSDDIAALAEAGDRFLVHPGYARLRLWNPAIEAVFGSRDLLPKVVSFRNKRYLDLTADDADAAWRFHSHPVPLSALYVLGGREPAAAAPRIEALSPADGLTALVANAYADFIISREQRARDFLRLAALARSVPIRRVARPDSMAALSDLCAAIAEDFARASDRDS